MKRAGRLKVDGNERRDRSQHPGTGRRPSRGDRCKPDGRGHGSSGGRGLPQRRAEVWSRRQAQRKENTKRLRNVNTPSHGHPGSFPPAKRRMPPATGPPRPRSSSRAAAPRRYRARSAGRPAAQPRPLARTAVLPRLPPAPSAAVLPGGGTWRLRAARCPAAPPRPQAQPVFPPARDGAHKSARPAVPRAAETAEAGPMPAAGCMSHAAAVLRPRDAAGAGSSAW